MQGMGGDSDLDRTDGPISGLGPVPCPGISDGSNLPSLERRGARV